MQTSLSCSLEAATPQALHRCSQPLRCRTFRALPLTGRSQHRRLQARLPAQTRAIGFGPVSGPSNGFLSSNQKPDSLAKSAHPSVATSQSAGRFSTRSGISKLTVSASAGGGETAASSGKPTGSSTAGSASKGSNEGGAGSKNVQTSITSRQPTTSASVGSSAGGPTPAGKATPTSPISGSSASSDTFSEKTVDVEVYDPASGPHTERRKVKVDKRQTSTDAESAVDNTTQVVQGGVDQAADAVDRGADQLAEGVSDAADQVQQGADQLQDVAEDLGETLEDAADAAEQQLSNATEQLQGAAEGAVNSAQNFAESLQKGAQSGSPYKDTPLSAMEPYPYEGRGRNPSQQVQTDYYKLRLLECVAGLDRGFAANSYATMQVESAALALTERSDPVQLSWTPTSDSEDKPSGLAQISGTWRLVYSSGFASGGVGGRQAGPPAGLLPRLGQVYQVISPYTSRLDNVLELYSGFPGLEPVVLTASLKHHFEALGGNIVQITFEDTEVKVTGGIGGLLGNLPEIALPQLPEPFKPSRQQRTSSFDVLYLDNDLRITRGSRGELRIFVKT